ncbi:MAG: hypothetical protein OFPI_03830 [Osedax symbiont Rs2]|nr:MAG: hypothetical protein OFPI_03830 [Osedax symbiont Rs2]
MNCALSVLQIFKVKVCAKQFLSQSFVRLTFSSERVKEMAVYGPDQWIKLLFDNLSGQHFSVPEEFDGYRYFLSLNKADRPRLRSYTLREFRLQQGEFDIDFVLHSGSNCASLWALEAAVGDHIYIRAHCVGSNRARAGFVWSPPKQVQQLLLVADETALPAALSIIDSLSRQPEKPLVNAFFSVPSASDCLLSPTWPQLHIHWLTRGDSSTADANDEILTALNNLALPHLAADHSTVQSLENTDKLWQLASSCAGDNFYAWIGGERTMVDALRRLLLTTKGIDKKLISFMAYWRRGKAAQ